MSANVKANRKQQEMKDLVAYLKKKYLQNLKYNIKRSCFSFDLGWCSIRLDIVNSEQGAVWGEVLRGQNPLSVKKVIC